MTDETGIDSAAWHRSATIVVITNSARSPAITIAVAGPIAKNPPGCPSIVPRPLSTPVRPTSSSTNGRGQSVVLTFVKPSTVALCWDAPSPLTTAALHWQPGGTEVGAVVSESVVTGSVIGDGSSVTGVTVLAIGVVVRMVDSTVTKASAPEVPSDIDELSTVEPQLATTPSELINKRLPPPRHTRSDCPFRARNATHQSFQIDNRDVNDESQAGT